MSKVHIITDSTAHFFDPAFPQKHHLTVVPLTIHFGSRSFLEGVDLDSAQFFEKVAQGAPIPTAASPSAEQFTAVYEEIARTHDSILSIHVSGKLSRTPHNARVGAEGLKGRCKIQVIDSLSTSVGLGVLVEQAALAAERGDSQEEIVRLVRGMIPRLYAVFFIETLDFLAQAGRIGKAQAVLGAMLGIKPFLTLEEGDIVPMEKVRTRQQAIEKIVEFVIEFSDIQRAAILQSSPTNTDDTRLLLERLAASFPGRRWPVLAYGPSLATFLGPDAMGVIVCDGEAAPERESGLRDE
ncbi:MAG: DegV family protein [Anaerolineales bacterium]